MSGPVALATVVRSGVVEATHLGSVAVCDARGRLVGSAGDADAVCFARSTTKPLQAAASLGYIGDELTQPEVAVMCASHNAEDVHVVEVMRLLDRAGLTADALRCPAAIPHGGVPPPRRTFHDCSGKHAGMLLACVRGGLDPTRYTEPDHPLQARVLDLVGEAAGRAPDAVGIDGCGLPVHAFPLRSLAAIYARLVRPDALGSAGVHVRRAVAAMRAEPYLVAGAGRICTDLMRAVPGVVVKIGAEGLICAALVERGLGIAVKVHDGAARARGPALLHALAQLGAVDATYLAELTAHTAPPVLGGGSPVGEIRAAFTLTLI